MNLSSIFEQNAYLSNGISECSDDEIKIIEKIFSSLKNPINVIKSELISIDNEFDTYKITSNNQLYTLKLSLDEDCKKIEYESKYLNYINPLIRPKYLHDGKIKIGDNIRYIITSYEDAESINEIGKGILVENFDNFCYSYSIMQKSMSLIKTHKDVMDDFYLYIDIEKRFDKEVLSDIKSHTDLNNILKCLLEIKTDLLRVVSIKNIKYNHICHGNLNLKNIIYRDNTFKFINFENSFQGHCFIDFCELIIEIGADRETEKFLFEKFCKYLNIKIDAESSLIYKVCYQTTIRKKILEFIVQYLEDTYVYESFRKKEIFNLCQKFILCYERFYDISAFQKNRDFLTKTIIEPILKDETL